MNHPGHTPDENLASRDASLFAHNATAAMHWFGQNVRSLRMALGIPQRQLAKAVGLHPDSLCQLERRGKPIRFTTAIAIAEALDSTVGDLLDER